MRRGLAAVEDLLAEASWAKAVRSAKPMMASEQGCQQFYPDFHLTNVGAANAVREAVAGGSHPRIGWSGAPPTTAPYLKRCSTTSLVRWR